MQGKKLIPALILIVFGTLSYAETDVGLSLYGTFTGKTDAHGVTVSPSNSAGGMIEVRHIANPILGFEGTYSFNGGTQSYSGTVTCPISTPSCPSISPQIGANAHEVTVDWVPSLKVANFRPFGVVGVGALFHVPHGGQAVATQTSTNAVYVYGAGLDWGLLPHLGLRFQYRGNLYKAPDLTQLFTSIDKFTHTAEPMIGIYLRL